MKIKFIVNPISGQGKQKDIKNTIRVYLEYTIDLDNGMKYQLLHKIQVEF